MTARIDWRIIAVAVALVVATFCAWNWAAWQRKASIAAGFGARVACSCRYVEGRDMRSCGTDLAGLPSMGLVHLSDRPEWRAVDASVPLLARRTARAVAGFGCVMDRD